MRLGGMFAVFIDIVVQPVQASGVGCYVKLICVSIVLNADDTLLLAPSVTALQQLLRVCETELACLDMAINVGKSACMRIGLRQVTVVEDRPIMPVKYCLPLPVFYFWP